MIYTLTLNPSIDYIIEMDEFKSGEVNRSNREFKYPGGKGINVSRVLTNLEVENKALGFVGGFTGKYIKDFLNNEGVATDFIEVEEDSRINVKIKSKIESEINGGGPHISQEKLEELYRKIEDLKEDDILVLAGNVQKTLPKELYTEIQKKVSGKNVKVVVDTTGEALVNTLKYKPFFIKPNKHELEEIFNVKLNSINEIAEYGVRLLEMGAQNVVISMAGDGALLITEGKIYKSNVPKGEVRNSVGAGDSLVGGFLSEYYKSKDLVKAFKKGVATGSASAFSLDLAKKEFVEELLLQVKVEEM